MKISTFSRGVVCLCATALLFVSCNNFLKAGEVRAEIEEAIEIANSSAITYYVTAEEGSGTLSAGQLRLKKKESFDVMFTPSDEWKFICWEVIDRTTGEVVPGVIEFKDATKLEVHGTVINPKDNLAIHAKCFKLPAIVDISPVRGIPQLANMPIEITFNMPMEAEDTPDQESLFHNFNNISLTYGLDEMQEFFEEPHFNAEKTVLTIVPKGRKLKAFIESKNASTINVQISINEKLCITNEDVDLYLIQNNISFKIAYKAEVDEEDPLKEYLYVSRQSGSLLTDNNHFLMKTPLDKTNQSEIMQNRTTGVVYIYGKYSDNDSGVKSVTVSEQRIKKSNDDSVTDFEKETHFTADNASFYKEGNYTTFVIEYHLLSEDVGQILLKTSVTDACDNTSESENLSVIYNNADSFKGVMITNAGRYTPDSQGPDFTTIDETKTIRITTVSPYDGIFELYEEIYGGIEIPGNNLDIFCTYTDDSNTPQNEPLTLAPDDGFGRERTHTFINVASLENFRARVIISDDIGNKKEVELVFPSAPLITVIQKTNSTAKIQYSGDTIESAIRVWEENGVVKTKDTGRYSDPDYPFAETINSGTTYKACILAQNADFNLIGAFGANYSVATLSSVSPVELALTTNSYRLSPGQPVNSKPMMNLTVLLKDDTWAGSKYDSIVMKVPYGNYDSLVTIPYGATEYTLAVSVEELSKNARNINIFGIKNGSSSQPTLLPVSKLKDPEYDIVPPEYQTGTVNFDEYFYDVWDCEHVSDVQSFALITTTGEKIILADKDKNDNFVNFKVPIWFVEEEGNNGYVYYEIKDTKGNTVIKKKGRRSSGSYVNHTRSSANSWTFGNSGSSSYGDFYTWGTNSWQVKYSFKLYSTLNAISIPDNTFIKLIDYYRTSNPTYYDLSDGTSISYPYYIGLALPQYIYTNSSAMTTYPENKYIQSHTADSVFVASDCPAVIYTVGTKKSAKESSSWSIDQWNGWHYRLNEQVYTYTLQDRYQKKYTIPVQELKAAGCKSYVVIVQFADESKQKSEVFEF